MNPTETTASSSELPADMVQRALAATPARVLVGRAGAGYATPTWLKLRADHAAARDAVHAELDLVRDFGDQRCREFGLFCTQTEARMRTDFLLRPDLGRRLDTDSRKLISRNCARDIDLQI